MFRSPLPLLVGSYARLHVNFHEYMYRFKSSHNHNSSPVFIRYRYLLKHYYYIFFIVRMRSLLITSKRYTERQLFKRRQVQVFSSNSNSGGDEPSNHFKTLGIEPKFSQDLSLLKNEYKRLMGELHPDRHAAHKSAAEMEDLHNMASAVTRAYDIISKPHTRAMHFLDVTGIPINENDNGEIIGEDFLMKVMMIREEVDDADSDKVRKEYLNDNNERMEKCCKDLEFAIESENYDLAKQLASELQYWKRVEDTIIESIDNVE